MATWYVRPSGWGGGTTNGQTYDTAWDGFTDITWGVGGIVAGDTLYVCGTHNEQLTIGADGASGSQITIRGDYAGDDGIIDGNAAVDYAIYGNDADYITITELEVLDTNDSLIYFRDSRNAIISNCDIHGTGGHGIKVYLGTAGHLITDNEIYDTGVGNTTNGEGCGIMMVAGVSGDNNTIEYNYFHDVGGVVGDHCIYNQTDGSIIRYNRFVGGTPGGRATFNQGTGTQFYYNTVSGFDNVQGVLSDNSGTITVYNNTFYGCLYAMATLTGNAGFTARNNIISNSVTGEFYFQETTGTTSNYNQIDSWTGTSCWGVVFPNSLANWRTASSQDANSAEGDPLLVSATDFHLQSGSPCINTGTDVGLTQDYEGTSVPQGAGVDMGAYEWRGSRTLFRP